jgi:methionine aminopeptidase
MSLSYTVPSSLEYFACLVQSDEHFPLLEAAASIAARRLSQITFECMWLGINAVRPGAFLGDIGAVIQKHAEKNGYSGVRL